MFFTSETVTNLNVKSEKGYNFTKTPTFFICQIFALVYEKYLTEIVFTGFICILCHGSKPDQEPMYLRD